MEVGQRWHSLRERAEQPKHRGTGSLSCPSVGCDINTLTWFTPKLIHLLNLLVRFLSWDWRGTVLLIMTREKREDVCVHDIKVSPTFLSICSLLISLPLFPIALLCQTSLLLIKGFLSYLWLIHSTGNLSQLLSVGQATLYLCISRCRLSSAAVTSILCAGI